jgi:hypothetical protein
LLIWQWQVPYEGTEFKKKLSGVRRYVLARTLLLTYSCSLNYGVCCTSCKE